MAEYGGLRAQRHKAFESAIRYIQNYIELNEAKVKDIPKPERDRLDTNGLRRIVCTEDGVVAISGTKDAPNVKLVPKEIAAPAGAITFAWQHYGIDLSSVDMKNRFEQVVKKYDVRKKVYSNAAKKEFREINNCAEASLWMTLEGLHSRNLGLGHAPRHLHTHRKNLMIWIFEIDRKLRPKQDSPCPNCQQWVRWEFGGVNGVKSS